MGDWRIAIRDNKIKYEGKVFSSDNFGDMTILNYINSKSVMVRFNNTKYVGRFSIANIRNGQVHDPLYPRYYSVGYLGIGGHKTYINKKEEECFSRWRGLLERAYSEKFKNKRQTYKDCSICDEWHNFQNFAKWYKENKPQCDISVDIDKDLLMSGNKSYSPEACCFLPHDINMALVVRSRSKSGLMHGVYIDKKKYVANVSIGGRTICIGRFNDEISAHNAYCMAKDNIAISLAIKYKNILSDNSYSALINYDTKFRLQNQYK